MIKKEKYNYFEEFKKVADYIVESANVLKEIMENFNIEKLNTDIHEVHKLENEADKIVHQMRSYLIKDFLPPIDREDIALISHKIDDIEDGVDEILINVKILDIYEIKPEVMELIDILVKGLQENLNKFSFQLSCSSKDCLLPMNSITGFHSLSKYPIVP